MAGRRPRLRAVPTPRRRPGSERSRAPWPGARGACTRSPIPGDSGAVVRALSRPPIELRSVDVARLTQLARRRKLDMPSAVAAALEGPQLSEEGRDRARAFLRLYRSASSAFEDRRPDAFVMRLIERIGPAPPAGVRHPRGHGRAPAQHRQAARAGHRLHAPRAPGHGARLRPLPGRRRGVGAARGRGRRPAVGAGRARDDDARREGARVRPRLRARAVGRRDARPVRSPLATCPTSC